MINMYKGGQVVMILGSISASGVGDPVKIDLIINPERYQQIGIHHAKCILGKNFFSMTM